MNQINAKGVVLTRTDYGEADRIITFLTPEKGKVRVMAKGVRKQKSKLAGGIELFSVSDITYIEGRKDLHTLVSSRLITHYGDIVTDIDRTMLGYEMLKIMNKILEDEGGQEFYHLLVQSLELLNDLSAPTGLAECSYLLQLMQLLGHLPNLTHDTHGDALPADGTFQFSFDDMSFFARDSAPFSQNHIKLLRMISHNPPASLKQVRGLQEYVKELAPLVRQMSRQYLVQF